MINESAFSIKVTVFFSSNIIESVTIVPRMRRFLILVPFCCLLPPVFLEGLLWASVGPMSWSGGPTVDACVFWVVMFDVRSIALLTMRGRGAGVNRSGFDSLGQHRWFLSRVFLEASASSSFIIVFSHSPKYVVVFGGVSAHLAEFPFVTSTRWWYWFWFGQGASI